MTVTNHNPLRKKKEEMQITENILAAIDMNFTIFVLRPVSKLIRHLSHLGGYFQNLLAGRRGLIFYYLYSMHYSKTCLSGHLY